MMDIRKLEDRTIRKGERWIYSAGFNVKLDLKDTERIDTEIDDIDYISRAGGIVIILSHHGGSGGDETKHLDFVADYLSKKLGKKVEYFPENITEAALNFVKNLMPGQIVIMGNTRFHKGEQKNDAKLAERFAKLGDFIAVGGFSKAHRENSSNNRILNYLPGYIARNHLREMQLLGPWVGEKDEYSVAILGGVKKEKIIIGLKNLSQTYDFVIPGGIVLNIILKAKGYEIGDSIIEDSEKTFEKEVEKILMKNGNKIYTPQQVIITKNFKDPKLINIKEGVPKNYKIVDFVLDGEAIKALEKAVNEKGRILLAGTPTFYKQGFKDATTQCISYMKNPEVKSIILGGDSCYEIPFNGLKCAGGGSSLEYLYKGTTAVCEALKRNKQRFS